MSKLKPNCENDVKALVKDWFDKRSAWHFAPIQNGLGVHGIHDRIGCVPVTVTQEMVGHKIGMFVSVEAKAPGRKREPREGLSVHQLNNMLAIHKAAGISITCDSAHDLLALDGEIEFLTGPLQ